MTAIVQANLLVVNLNRIHVQIHQIQEDASSVSGLSSFLKKSVPSTDYILSGDTVLKIDGHLREGVCEVLFERDGDGLNIPSMILDALLASPIGKFHQINI